MIVIGIVGAIGAGKTEVLRLLQQHGARTVAADELSRAVVAPGQPGLQRIREAFGEEVIDERGELMRSRLAERIFADETARRRLDDLLHPLMLELLKQRLAQWRAEGVEVAVVEAAVLREMGAVPLMDRLVLVTAPEDVRRRRLQERDGLSAQEAQKRIEAHRRLGLEEAAQARELVNAGNLAQLAEQVEQLWRELVCS